MSIFAPMGLVALLLASAAVEAGMMGSGGMMDRDAQPPSKGWTQGAAAPPVAEYCGGCHALPELARHTGRQWAVVLIRMEGYMRAQGRKLPSLQEEHEILAYLERKPDRHR